MASSVDRQKAEKAAELAGLTLVEFRQRHLGGWKTDFSGHVRGIDIRVGQEFSGRGPYGEGTTSRYLEGVLPWVPKDMRLKRSENGLLRIWPMRRRYLWMDDPVWDNTFLVRSQDSEIEVRNFLDQGRRDRIVARLGFGWKLVDSVLSLKNPNFYIMNGALVELQVRKLVGIARVIVGDSTLSG